MANKIRVSDREYDIPDTFTLGDMADMEMIAGQGYDFNNPGPRGLLAIAYVAVKKINPKITIDELRALDTTAIQGIPSEDDALPPVSGGTPTPNEPASEREPSTPSSSNGSDGNPAATPASSGVPA